MRIRSAQLASQELKHRGKESARLHRLSVPPGEPSAVTLELQTMVVSQSPCIGTKAASPPPRPPPPCPGRGSPEPGRLRGVTTVPRQTPTPRRRQKNKQTPVASPLHSHTRSLVYRFSPPPTNLFPNSLHPSRPVDRRRTCRKDPEEGLRRTILETEGKTEERLAGE